MLFAYHSTPHSVTGFTPFQLVYGFNVPAPLEVRRDQWLDGGVPDSIMVEW